MLPDLIKTALELIPMIVEILFESLPELIQAGIEILIALISGIIEAIPELIACIPQIISAVVEGLSSLPGVLKDLGITLVKSLWNGVLSMASWLKDKVTGFFSNIFSSVKDSFDGDGSEGDTGGGSTAVAGGHAEGGVFTEPHVAPFAEGGKAEAVVPLTKPKRALEVLGQMAEYFGGKLTDDNTAGLIDGMQSFVSGAMGLMDSMSQNTAFAGLGASGGSQIINNNFNYDNRANFTVNDTSGKPEATAKAVGKTMEQREKELRARNTKGVID